MINQILRRVQFRFFPTDVQKALKRWQIDGGDYENRFNYDLTPTSLVLDVGGYEGQWASDIFSRYRCKIFVFEPVKEFAERIELRFRSNPNIEILQYGLGGATRGEEISVSKDGSSVFRDSDNKQEIQIVDVADWIEHQYINEIDLMKINIEGGEYELLDRLIETNLVRIIRNIQVQFHEIDAESGIRMRKIQERLEETHYPTYQYRFVWENWVRYDR